MIRWVALVAVIGLAVLAFKVEAMVLVALLILSAYN